MSDRFFATCLIVVDLIRHFTLSIQILVRRLCRPCKWKIYLDNKYVYFGSQMLLTFLMLAPTNDMISYNCIRLRNISKIFSSSAVRKHTCRRQRHNVKLICFELTNWNCNRVYNINDLASKIKQNFLYLKNLFFKARQNY